MRRVLFFILVFTLFLSFTRSTFAYRPYVSTNASVASEHKWWMQTGFFTLSRERSVSTITTPKLDLSYGFIKDWDVGATAAMQAYKGGDNRNIELTDTSFYLDWVIRDGVLQDKTGPSVMVESNLFLPQTVEGLRNDLGFNTILAVSMEAFKFGCHLNAAVNFDQEEFDPGFLWGVILEYPFQGKFRVGVEFTGLATYSQQPDNTGGVGIQWTIGPCRFDCGARIGLSEAADDWQITTGVSFAF